MDDSPDLADSLTEQRIEDHRDERRWHSLLSCMAADPASGLVEVAPGRYYIRKDFTADRLDQD